MKLVPEPFNKAIEHFQHLSKETDSYGLDSRRVKITTTINKVIIPRLEALKSETKPDSPASELRVKVKYKPIISGTKIIDDAINRITDEDTLESIESLHNLAKKSLCYCEYYKEALSLPPPTTSEFPQSSDLDFLNRFQATLQKIAIIYPPSIYGRKTSCYISTAGLETTPQEFDFAQRIRQDLKLSGHKAKIKLRPEDHFSYQLFEFFVIVGTPGYKQLQKQSHESETKKEYTSITAISCSSDRTIGVIASKTKERSLPGSGMHCGKIVDLSSSEKYYKQFFDVLEFIHRIPPGSTHWDEKMKKFMCAKQAFLFPGSEKTN